ncbi:YicC/YloC family endoribonuclease [Clostridium guangxiense]|uniref:YicC/YloC family endoribonuclease n=1 Tax=Clostridium guangxiense TaxID=1662055 RepID=UPI001E54FB73|nr:YicC/YloC family endoribonuclease [Clostridium guangxiense]MCD2346033.1 YicC family protein [Clostridium guangxiense]
MLKSMTGFGRAIYDNGKRNFTIELKSVNHRYLDINVKLPRSLISLEDKIRREAQQKLKRGKVDIFVTQNIYNDDDYDVKLNKNLADSYYNCLRKIKESYDVKDDISVSLISKFPDVISIEQKEENFDEIWNEILIPLKDALNKLIDMREKEGAKLKEDIENKCDIISENVCSIEEKASCVVEEYRMKLDERIKELLGGNKEIDESRISMEVAIFADKACIDEEIVRLKSHIIQLKDTLQKDEPIGRKLDFIVQEMNREANTIASKSNNINIVHSVLDIKNDIEKIREQIQNIE